MGVVHAALKETFVCVGCLHCHDAVREMVAGPHNHTSKQLADMRLHKEDDNVHDPQAVAVQYKGRGGWRTVGHVPRSETSLAREFLALADEVSSPVWTWWLADVRHEASRVKWFKVTVEVAGKVDESLVTD